MGGAGDLVDAQAGREPDIDGFVLGGPGAYAFVIQIDGTEMDRLVFRAAQPSSNMTIRQ